MIEREIIVRMEFGLHARPASYIVDRLGALRIDSAIMICKGVAADLCSIISLLVLAVATGDTATVRISGQDAQPAMDIVEKVLSSEKIEDIL
jgi:phosphotransferase system HPr (HPr) family protein